MKVGEKVFTPYGAVKLKNNLPQGERVVLEGIITKVDKTGTPSYDVEFELNQLIGYQDFLMFKNRARVDVDADGNPTGKVFYTVQTIEVYKNREEAV